MKRISEKLRSQGGASILLALMLFLVCFMVSSVIISSATASVDKMRERETNQEEYLAISSAADVLQEVIGGLEFTGWENRTVYQCRGIMSRLDPVMHEDETGKCTEMAFEVVGEGARMRDNIERMVYKTFESHTKFVPPTKVEKILEETFVITAEGMEDVNVKVTLNTETYNILCVLTLADSTVGNRNAITVQFLSQVTAPEKEAATNVVNKGADTIHMVETVITHEDGTPPTTEMRPAAYDITVYTLTTKVLYGSGTMIKGVYP